MKTKFSTITLTNGIAGTPGTRDFLFASMQWSQTHPNAWGDPGTYVGYGPMWAQVSMTPFSQYKGWVAEGGIRNGLIVSGPNVQRQSGSINHGLMHVADIMPTLLEVAGSNYPKTYQGKELRSLEGKSWNPVLAGKVDSPRNAQDYLGWEVFGNRAVRQGDWKLRWQFKPFGKGDWELFNVASDPAERVDLAAKQPQKLREMLAVWDNYAKTNNVILPSRSVFETLDDKLPERVPVEEGYPPLLYKSQFVPPQDLVAEPEK
ncbi:MAG: sulfatase/phosphatase domain-containing protein [Burkholderiales bacterium]